ncbi:MAG: hypothetical protein EOM67_12285 [Spirochaetia bacterium]|nr:hypothetical protein [Spirochaetia bacterium]
MKDIPIAYEQMDEFSIGTLKENELTPEINRVIHDFDMRFADLVVSYDQDISTEGIDNRTTAGEQLALCVNMIQALGVGLAVLEGLHNQATSMAMEIILISG